jgi:hypothetical protein
VVVGEGLVDAVDARGLAEDLDALGVLLVGEGVGEGTFEEFLAGEVWGGVVSAFETICNIWTYWGGGRRLRGLCCT